MQTERVTYLTTPARKALLAQRAAAQGISMGEYLRRKAEGEDELTADEESALAALVAEVNEAVPKMLESIDRMIKRMDKSHQETDKFLRKMGVR